MNKGQIESAAVIGIDNINTAESLQYAIGGDISPDQLNKFGIISTTEMNTDYGNFTPGRGETGREVLVFGDITG